MQRYEDLSLKIESFRLSSGSAYSNHIIFYHNLIAGAMKMGATDVQLALPSSLTLGQEVLGSEALFRLSVRGCEIDGKYMSCASRLKSLSLENAIIRDSTISCCNSLEELSLSKCCGLVLGRANLNELHKLRRLFLDSVNVEPLFFTEFASRFPCLKDFTLFNSRHCNRKIDIATTSLQTITFKVTSYIGPGAKFNVPNIKKFTYSGSCLPNLSIKSSSREWEFDISLVSNCLYKTSWFLNLKKVLRKLRLSRISLCIKLKRRIRPKETEHDVDNVEAVAEPLVLENLMIVAPPTLRYALLLRLFVAFRPKSVTLVRPAEQHDAYFDTLCKRLMHQVITPNCGIPDQDIFGRFGLKKVCMEKDYEKYDNGFRGTKTRFELIWEDVRGTKARIKLIPKDFWEDF